MTSLRTRRLSGVVAVAAMAAAGLAMTGGSSTAAANGPTMDIQLLSFNDFHGNLQPPSGSSGRIVTGHTLGTDKAGNPIAVDVTKDAGGVEYLATHLKQARQGHPYSLTVAAGDLIGASPFLSAAFHDEPTIEAMNALGLDASAVGNHEFDEGYKELQRMANGGCLDDGAGANNQDSCPGGKTFTGANFDYLAANVVYAGTNKTILPPYTIKNIKGAKIGFIGMTLKDTPSIVTAAGVAGLQFKDEVATANALVPVLRAQGVNAIVVLIHQGGTPNQETWYDANNNPYKVNPTYDYTCAKGGSLAADSPIIPIAKGLDPAIDMIVSGHTHQPYVCDIKDPAGQPRMVTSASSFGRLFTDTELTYDRRTQDIVRTSVQSANMVVTRDVPKDPAETKIISDYSALARPIASRVLGHITTDVTRTGNAGGESQLGDLIADAQLADPSVVTAGKTPDIAFMNPGGIRADLTYANSPYGEAPGDVTFEEAFTVQPFNNYLVSLDLTGAQVKQLLTEQWSGANSGSGKKILQVNKDFNYTYSGTTLGTVTLKGQPLVDTQTYRIVTNNFLQGGGDNFPTMAKGTNVYYGGLDIDAFANYLSASSPYTPGPLTRITAN
ncbi:bifunctional metallophosphatase/5'-nucleotidase [Pedococcus sp. NPDC057267]|uniref:bifunctional metallophosphatase/5'-nucleotidase n=1 Tax=Pedococcus sp. NPDC057267 TaxID=3346077 RepID=UPI00362E06B9